MWYRDEDGALKFVVGYPDDGEEHTEDDYFRVGIDLKLMENAKGEYNIQDNCYYSNDDYLADGGDEELADTSTWEENGGPKEFTGGSLWFECNFNSMLLSNIMDIMNSTDTSSWSEPQCIFMGGVDLRNVDSYFDNNMYMARLCIVYTDPETNKEMIAWDYIASESALTNENNPFTYLDEKPSDERINTLKQNGFKWAPKGKAWQRPLTNQTMSVCDKIGFIKPLDGRKPTDIQPKVPQKNQPER